MYIFYLNFNGHFEHNAVKIQTKLNGAVFYGTPPQKSLPEQLARLNIMYKTEPPQKHCSKTDKWGSV